ncbi:hypothetical protein GCM10022409_02960 [Hymenobacter glaciei]|uniref:Uncharacterized protein n=1 Tax=Hymenobacter glaciei TaxID=877209 RepID=A0ABP7T8E2_9BACT
MGLVRPCFGWLLVFGCTSCFDLNPSKTTIHAGYYVRDDFSQPYSTLYLETEDGSSVERCPNVKRVGYERGYIFIQAERGNYWFAVQEDKGWNSLDPAAALLLNGPLNFTEFQQAMLRLGVGEIAYQFP